MPDLQAIMRDDALCKVCKTLQESAKIEDFYTESVYYIMNKNNKSLRI